MAISPNTNLFLLMNPLELDNKNQIMFSNTTEQYNYFKSLPYLEVERISYQRHNNVIRFPAHIDTLLNYNYCMYQNNNYNNKWFYAFITNMRYVNDNMTEIFIKTDSWQTWQFDLKFMESFVEREMINPSEDFPGSNLVPEGLETGELQVGGTAEFDDLEPVNIVAYAGDKLPIGIGGAPIADINQGGYIVNGIASSVVFLIVENNYYNVLLNNLQYENFSDYIVSCFSVPRLAVSNFMTNDNLIPGSTQPIWILQNGNTYNQSPTSKTLIGVPNDFEGYVPRNAKLRTYPYLYLGFNPSNGSSKIYRYEDFVNGQPQFKIISEVNPNPSIVFIPQNYRGQTGDSLSDIANLNGYPTLSNKSDYFNTWLAQNGEIINLQMQQEQFNYEIGQITGSLNAGSGLLGSIENGASGNYGGLANSVISTANNLVGLYANSINHDFYIKNQMAQIEKQKLLPDKVNMSSSNATLIGYNMNDKNIFTRYNIRRQFAERIDKFFDMYGYLTNKVKIPNFNNRPNWNYVKTIGINILAAIPQEDLQIIKNMFDNGVTLWHNTDNFLDYSKNNK